MDNRDYFYGGLIIKFKGSCIGDLDFGNKMEDIIWFVFSYKWEGLFVIGIFVLEYF